MKTKTKNQPKPLGRVIWMRPDDVDFIASANRAISGDRPFLIIPMTGPHGVCNRAAVVEEMARVMCGENYWPQRPLNRQDYWRYVASDALTRLGWPESGERKKRRTT